MSFAVSGGRKILSSAAPVFSAVLGKQNLLHSVTAVESDAFHRDVRAGLELRAVGEAGDEGADVAARATKCGQA